MFLENRVYQGSSGVIYPHPIVESVSDEKTDVTYTAIVLENKYLEIVLLPGLGGRVQMARDKTNDFHFVYYNPRHQTGAGRLDRTLDFRWHRVQLAAASPSQHFSSGRLLY